MARAKIEVIRLGGYNLPVEADGAEAVDKTNNMVVDVANMAHERLLFKLVGGTAKYTATLKAGDFSDKALGDLAVAVDPTEAFVLAIESARFLKADGKIDIDITSTGSPTGTIEAYLLP